jgi:hypothetical protein
MKIDHTIEILLQGISAYKEKISNIILFYDKPLPKAAVEEITEYEEKIKELKNVMDFLEKYKNN